MARDPLVLFARDTPKRMRHHSGCPTSTPIEVNSHAVTIEVHKRWNEYQIRFPSTLEIRPAPHVLYHGKADFPIGMYRLCAYGEHEFDVSTT